MVSLSSSQATGFDVVLGLDPLPLGFHLHHDTIDLSSEGVKDHRSTCWESRIEVEAAVEAFQTRKSCLPGIVFCIEKQSVLDESLQHLKYH